MLSPPRVADPFWIVDNPFAGPLLWITFFLTFAAVATSTALLARSRRRHLVANAGVVLSTLMVVMVAGEGVVRVYHRVDKGIPLFVPMRVFLDHDLGWEGNQSFGNPESRRPKIFFVGDSFTTPLGIKPEDMYYHVVGRALDAEIFAYGGGGYGTLQQYLVLDRYLDAIKPNLVLLQVHSNDFINNQWELERASYFNNNLAVRPYLIDGAIQYRFPEFLGRTRLFLAAQSRLFYWTIEKVDRLSSNLAQRGFLHSVERNIQDRGIEVASFRQAVHTTETLIALIKKRLGAVPLLAFAADDDPTFIEHWRAIYQRQRVPFIEDVAIRIREHERAGADLRIADRAHWNAAGHEVSGRALAEQLSQRHLLAR